MTLDEGAQAAIVVRGQVVQGLLAKVLVCLLYFDPKGFVG